MWNNSKPKTSSYFSDYHGTVVARAVRGKTSDSASNLPKVMTSSLPTRSALPLRMVISDMARRKAPSPQNIKNLSQIETCTTPDAYLQESRDVYSETQYGLVQDKYSSGRKNNLSEKNQISNVINDMRKKFNVMYGKPNDGKDESEEEYAQINEVGRTSNPQKIKFTELYGKRSEFSPPDMMSFAEFVKRVNKKSSIMTPQERCWADESFDGKTDDRKSLDNTSDISEINCSNRNSQQSWKKRYLSTEMFLHSIKEEWPDNDDQNDPISSDVEEVPSDSPNNAVPLDIRKRKGGIFNDSFEISPEKKNRFAPPHFEIFGNADEGNTSGEESATSEVITTAKVLNDDIHNKTKDYPFYEDLLTVCSQDSVYSDDSTDTKKTAFRLNNVQLYDAE